MVVFAFSPAKSAEAADFSFSVGFHDELSPYGTWINVSSYGNVWRPYGYSSFRPYTNGYWGYTNYGPTWYGYEPYASYVYHYGNWVYSPQYGWIWIPGYDWHAGRVDWSYGGGYIAWRPSFPSGYSYGGYGAGYGGGFGNDYNFWVVIDADRFGYRNYQPYAYRSSYVRDLFDRRVFRQRYDTFQRAELERIVRRPVRQLDVRERTVRIGDRQARLLATPDEEVRIRKQVTQIRGRNDNRRVVERDTVMKQKFEDIRTKSNSKNVGRSGNDRRETELRSTVIRKNEVRKPYVSTKQKVEKSNRPTGKKVISTREVQKKSNTKAIKSNQRKSNDKVIKSNLSSRRPGSDSVRSASSYSRKPSTLSRTSYSSRKPAKVEHTSRTVRKSEVKSNVRSGSGKAQVSKGKTTTRKESVRKQKPRRKD